MTAPRTLERTASLAWMVPRALLGAAIVFSLIFSLVELRSWLPTPHDWWIFVQAPERFHGGGLYELGPDYAYRWSPILAPALAVLGWLGPFGWRALHLVAALALPSWPLRLLALVSWPFWFDTNLGNVMIFVLLAAAWALRGNLLGTAAFLAMTVLIPRPLMLPIAAWLLWQRPGLRVPFAIGFALHAAAVLLTGWGDEWIGALLSSTSEMGHGLNLSPSSFLGLWWMVVALPAAAWLTWRGRLGWASLLAAPYWLPYYLLMPLLEIDRAAWPGRVRPMLDSPADERPHRSLHPDHLP